MACGRFTAEWDEKHCDKMSITVGMGVCERVVPSSNRTLLGRWQCPGAQSPAPQPGGASATFVPSIFSSCLWLTSIHHGISHRAAAASLFSSGFPSYILSSSIPLSSVTECNWFTINILKALWLCKYLWNFIQRYYLLSYNSLVAHSLKFQVKWRWWSNSATWEPVLQYLWRLMDIFKYSLDSCFFFLLWVYFLLLCDWCYYLTD